MPKLPEISAAEWKVMRLLWSKSPQPAYDLATQLAEQEDWSSSTVKTLLGRLQKKKAVRIERYKNLFLYSPAVEEKDCIARETDSLLDRLFGGSVEPLLVHFARRQKVTPAQLDRLKRVLREGPDNPKPGTP
jgi:BlaI family penicillinase repressor